MWGAGSFSPLSLPSLQLWLKADVGLTLSTAPYAGTGTVTQVGTAITGIGTAFQSEVVIGDTLTGTLISGTVTAIADNTHLTVDASNSGAGAAFTVNPTAGVTDRVTTWADQSGVGNNVTQATASKKAVQKLAAKNSLPAVRGNGFSTRLSAGSLIDFGANNTIFVVIRPSNISAAAKVILGDGTGQYAPYFDNTAFFYASPFGSTGNASVAHGMSAAAWYVIAIRRTGTTVRFYKNGVQLGTDQTLSANNSLTLQALFALTADTNFGALDIGEVVAYSAALSDGNVQNIFTYLNARWAVY